MGTVDLLSREGEIAIAKRIEAGKEAMIEGLCESPLTFQAIIIWRDELNEGQVLLRDIIDLEASYIGPDAKNKRIDKSKINNDLDDKKDEEGESSDDGESDDYNEYESRMEELIFENNLLSEDEYSEEVFSYADVVKYRIKGVWYFDKRQSDLRYRPIAIAPVVITPRSKANMKEFSDPNMKPDYVEMFWIFYPDARFTLHNAKAFKNKNTSKPVSYDHLINSRHFSAYIYKEDNVYQDRGVKDYISDNALMQLLESQRIKEKIRNLEQDMWSY